jgi:hypothetical protein
MITATTHLPISPDLLRELESHLAKELVGLRYLFSQMSRLDSLIVHFGEETMHNHPRLYHKRRGTFVLCLRGSAWLLRSGTKPIVIGSEQLFTRYSAQWKGYNFLALLDGKLIDADTTISRATQMVVEPLNAIGLTLELSDGSMFLILPTPPDATDADDLPEPADWELLTPTQRLRVGPGSTIEVNPS